jgi:hypothetical protein
VLHEAEQVGFCWQRANTDAYHVQRWIKLEKCTTNFEREREKLYISGDSCRD